MDNDPKKWLVNINSCPYYVKAARAISAISSALLQFKLDHPKNPLTELDIYCHQLTREEEMKYRKLPKVVKDIE